MFSLKSLPGSCLLFFSPHCVICIDVFTRIQLGDQREHLLSNVFLKNSTTCPSAFLMDLQAFYDILIKTFPRVSLVLAFPAQPLLGELIPSHGFKHNQKVSPLLWVSLPAPGPKAAGMNSQLLAGHLHLSPRGPKLNSVSFLKFVPPSFTSSSVHDTSTHPKFEPESPEPSHPSASLPMA